MIREATFVVDQTVFHCDKQSITAEQFVVRSIPNNYSVIIKNNNAVVADVLAALNENKKKLLLIDARLFELYQSEIDINRDRIFAFHATEHTKGWDSVSRVLMFLQQRAFDKSAQLVVVGGGITQEVSAFAAKIYKRGIAWCYFPTTLVSMCDSCVGGKAGVNFNGAKNQLGLYSTPSSIHINPQFLKTLSRADIKSGLAEILKSCVIGGPDFVSLYQSHVINGEVKSLSSFKALVVAALQVKKAVVETDEFESNERHALNYGHTFGHAIEALSDYHISHGQAVAIGMMLANKLSHIQGRLSRSDLISLNQLCFELIDKATLNRLKKISWDNIVSLIQKDKKSLGDTVNFVVIQSPGNTQFVQLPITWLSKDKVASMMSAIFERNN